MSESSQKRSIELIDAIESILKHKPYPLSLEYLALKLRKKYTMKSVNKPAFVNMVQCEISKYPHRIIPQENGLFILANSHLATPPSQLEDFVTSSPHTTFDSEFRSSPSWISGCDEELEVHRLAQEVLLLKELATGCLAWNHGLAGLIAERRRELEELNTDTDLLLTSYHTIRENGDKVNVKSQKKKYSKKSGKEGRDGKHKRRIIVAKIPKRNLSLKTISVKKSKIQKSATKSREHLRHESVLPQPPVPPLQNPTSPSSKPDSPSSAEASGCLENSTQSDDSCSVFSTHGNIPTNKPITPKHPSSADSD